MKIILIGATGFVGSNLAKYLVSKGHIVSILTRNIEGIKQIEKVSYIQGNYYESGNWQNEIENYNAIINLSGASIYGLWTEKRKQIIYNSRILPTRNIVQAIKKASKKPEIFINVSAVGYYGFDNAREFDETSENGKDFLAKLCFDWEKEAIEANKDTKVVITRLGIVLGKNGGIVGKLEKFFNFYLGAKIGSGNQYMSWIHIEDLCRAFEFILNSNISGPVNLCAPKPAKNSELVEALSKSLKKPCLFTIPEFAIKLFLGEFGNIILQSQKVKPKVLLEKGFVFKYSEIEKAIGEIFR